MGIAARAPDVVETSTSLAKPDSADEAASLAQSGTRPCVIPCDAQSAFGVHVELLPETVSTDDAVARSLRSRRELSAAALKGEIRQNA